MNATLASSLSLDTRGDLETESLAASWATNAGAPHALTQSLLEALTSPVRWREVLIAMRERGVTRYVETGPGRVLSGLVKRTVKGADVIGIGKLETARA